MGRSKYLTELEESALRAVLRLRDKAYGVSIGDTLSQEAGREVSYGALYRALERLETTGYLKTRLGDPTPERGGRAKKFYTLTGTGQRALNEATERVTRLTPWLLGSES